MIERYEDPAVAEWFSPGATYAVWAMVEMCCLEVGGYATPDPDQIFGQAKGLASDAFTQHVRDRERETRHEFVAFLQVLRQALTDLGYEQAHEHLHEGLTSSDVQDTTLALQTMCASAHVLLKVGALANALSGLISRTKTITQIGRTHGQYAVPRPFAHRWDVSRGMLDRQAVRLRTALAGISIGKLSGPVGTDPIKHAQAVFGELGLSSAPSTQIVPRDGLAHWAHVLAGLTTICEDIALQVRLLSQSDIDEVYEGQQVGSSAMPHKRHNPAMSENICGLARMARSRANELELGVVQWGDRDLAHSSVERVSIPDLLHLVCTALTRTADLVLELAVDEQSIRQNNIDAQTRADQATRLYK
jgi:adenylosuccinate lyase